MVIISFQYTFFFFIVNVKNSSIFVIGKVWFLLSC